VLHASLRHRLLRGAAVYVVSALRELFRFPGLPIGVDGAPAQEHLLAVFSNGSHFGGAFHIAPGARIDDGLVDAILVRDVANLARLPLLASAIRGTHVQGPHATQQRTPRMTLRFAEAPWFEADGELCRAAGPMVEVASVPGALRVVDAL
jgi:diacylglycerol kinase family enzyme